MLGGGEGRHEIAEAACAVRTGLVVEAATSCAGCEAAPAEPEATGAVAETRTNNARPSERHAFVATLFPPSGGTIRHPSSARARPHTTRRLPGAVALIRTRRRV